MFAFSPVNQVTSTHDTIIDTVGELVCGEDINDDGEAFDTANNDCD